MIYLIKPIEKKNDFSIYILSNKETDVVLKEIENLNFDFISQDEGVSSGDGTPFLLTQINPN